MQIVFDIGIILLAYIFGSIPFGLLIVKLKTGKDIRQVESGRTGGTNAMRAAGFWAGFGTAMLDILKGAVGVWVARWLTPDQTWVHVLAPIAAILGHNYSVFLIERDENGKIVRFRGGAGGAPSVGGAMGLWPGSILIILPLGMLTFFSIGIASITTMAVALFAIIVFAVRASQGLLPWAYVWYGVGAELLLIWALRPNLKKLFEGNERVVKYSLNGWLRARREAKAEGGK
ncbi:MAG: glycerol-3-phosphate acyltransferase [Anaerolineales bacterium]|jgi:glycerol-3-phosphate acyltransferase PlsY|uniref:glycerol-3-phosphate acyltransferase n=1 Tax=Candidatus Villigracilis affinis TaxID=3140682 RepID=UPI001D836FC7|nr:glycerol-3-phosphate acyltransferase [Anaerolineales bacterium]MBK9602353.1 glycerol-3-phosphate acyltransferase [Anaerolineales bacterium]MBL0345591.1 glycerol-3-phosphate acyltransferase [Anaerolineales bacterium]